MTAPAPGPRTLADQIRHCAGRTAEPGNDGQRAGIAVTLQGIANQVEQVERDLAALKQVSRGYCPQCGRGDAAPSVEDWQQERERAEQAETERDRQWQLKEIALGELASVRLLAEQIKRCADWPGITDTATYPEIVESLRACATGLVRALTAGPRPDGPQSRLSPPGNAAATTDQTEAPIGRQEPAQAAPDRCACGAPAALIVGYRSESGPELQCVRCATNDTRTLIGSRDLVNDRGERWWMQEPAQAATGYHANRRRQNPGGER